MFATTNGDKVTSPANVAIINSTLADVAALPHVAMIEGHPVIVSPVSGGPYKTNPRSR